MARWLDPGPDTAVSVPDPPPPPPPQPVNARAGDVWPGVCERFALQILGHAENLRPALDRLEADEHDEERLRWLYQVDHSATRIRRAARDMRVLAGVEDGELGGYVSSLTDVVRAAESSIEHYSKVVIGKVVDLAVVSYASDDVSSLLAALLDNATNYSPATVTVSAHLLDNGGVMFRIEDNGIGIPPAHLEVLNAALAGPVLEVTDRTGKHTGFPVLHRLARKHGIGVRLASRSHPGTGAPGGTVAMVMIPPDLLCEVPDEGPAIGPAAEYDEAPEPPGAYPNGSPGSSPRLSVARPSGFAEMAQAGRQPTTRGPGAVGGLPRRARMSLRGDGGERVRAPGRTGEADPSAAARSFAEDLSTFAAGDQTGRQRPAGTEQDYPEGEGR